MNPKARKPPNAPGPDVEAARENLRNNKNDEIEGTFCYALFEDRVFDEALLVPLIADIECVLGQDEVSPEDRRLAHWVMLGTLRCLFSHFDASDFYKIENLDAEVYGRWSGDYFERFRALMSG
jgi:hypothetical protein